MYDALSIEKEMRELWARLGIFKLLTEKNKGGEPFFFMDGPPYANNIPHVGHIRNLTYKDIFIRKAFMQGKSVFFKPGFDTHGLPIESMVEKRMGLKSKKDIEEMGVTKFLAQCKELAITNKDLWYEIYDLMAHMFTYHRDPYLTYHNSYVQTGWWAFKTLWDKGLVYEGKRPVYWCAHCETALAGYEVTDSYAMVSDPSVYVMFKLKEKDRSGEDQHLLVYTTTPWTLPANIAIAVAPDELYVRVKTEKGLVILAKPRLHILDGFNIDYKVMDEFKGKELEGKQYESLIDCPAQKSIQGEKNALKVLMSIPMLKSFSGSKMAIKKEGSESDTDFSEFVTMDDGTGLVHCAPGHGKSDYEFGNHYNLPRLSPLDNQCKFTKDAAPYEGKFCKDQDKDIMKDLDQQGKLLYSETIQHKYPLCWRCKSKLIFRLSDQWFISIEPIKEKMLKANEEVNWQPDYAKGKFHHWVEGAGDWNVSRQRYWGIPLPIWRSEDKEETLVIGSVEELKKYATEGIADDFDLHDASRIELRSESGKILKRVVDIADVWFDSGVAPYASLGYPFDNKEVFDYHYPIDQVNESQDQIRGWFYHLMFCSVGVLDKPAFKQVSMPGWVVDARGDKMSKSVGNVAWAKDVLEEVGADMLRFYYFYNLNPADLFKFNLEVAKKEVGKFLNIFWNLHNMVMQAEFTKGVQVANLQREDRWAISALQSTIKDYKKAVEEFQFHEAGRGLAYFLLDDISRWYIQLTRERMDQGDETPYQVLYDVLLTVCKLLVPVAPHISEKIYQDFNDKFGDLKESVHLEKWPKHDANLIDEELEQEMREVQKVVPAILNAREKAKLSVRWPIADVVVVSSDGRIRDAAKKLADLIETHTNSRKVTIVEKMDKLKVSVQPDRSKIGMDYKERSQKVIKAIEAVDDRVLVDAFDKDGQYPFDLDGEKHHLIPEYVIVSREIDGPYTAAEFKGGHVYVEITRTPELDAEGYAREIARRVQALRKKAGMHKGQTIALHIRCDEELRELIQPHEESMAAKVGADSLVVDKIPKETTPQWSEEFSVKKYSVKVEFDLV